MESVRGRLVVMVAIGLTGGVLVIHVLKSEGILSPKKSSSSSSVLDHVVERGDTAALLENQQREWPEGMKEELTIVEKMGKDDTNTNTITAEDINAYNWNDVNELLQIFHLRAPQKTQADEGDTAADAERGANLTEKDATTIATSPVKIKKRGRDVNMPVVIALVFLLVISLISLINLCCCCFHCTRCERKEVKDEKPVLLL